jgi:hypothetical protein
MARQNHHPHHPQTHAIHTSLFSRHIFLLTWLNYMEIVSVNGSALSNHEAAIDAVKM